MKVLFIANTFPSPDVPKVAPFNIRAAKNLTSEGVSLEIFHLRAWKPGRKVSSTYTIDGVKITSVAFPFHAGLAPRMKALNVGLYKRQFYNFLKNNYDLSQFDIIHTVGAAHAGVVGGFLKYKTGIPHIAQCIGADVNYVLPEIKTYKGVKGFENYVDIFVGNSHSLANQAKSLFPDKPAAVVYRGIDLQTFKPDPFKLNEEFTVFSYLGGFSAGKTIHGRNEKGALVLLKAWRQLIEEHPDLNIILHFAGPRVTYEEVAENLQRKPEELKVKIIGHLDRTEVRDFMQSSHVMLIPSMWDGLPNVGTESAACGCAIIGSTAGGIPEVVGRGNLGILVEPGNVKELKDAIYKLATDRDLLNFYRKNSRPFMEANLDASQFAPGYIKIYNQLAKKQ